MTVFGATGRIGTQVVRQALAAGHEVIAVVREPSRLAVRPSRELIVVRAEVTDLDAIVPAVEATDAVVSALGPRPGDSATICSSGTASVLQAMSKVGVDRLVAVSADGAFAGTGDGPLTRYVAKPLLQRLLRDSFADVRRMEDGIRASGLGWTIVRPPRLTNGSATGRYRTAVDRSVRRGWSVARADVADAILRALADPATAHHWLGVAN
jgi:putative NADH-flavin reductase